MGRIRSSTLLAVLSGAVLIGGAFVPNPSDAGEGKVADIIIAIDSSSSMEDVVQGLKGELSGFVQLIVSSGVDLHFIIIADGRICFSPPFLGCGGGGDANLVLHPGVPVGSKDALTQVFLSQSQWAYFLRPSSYRSIVVVGDEDSELSAEDFHTQLLSRDPEFAGYRFHGIVSTKTRGCGVQALEYIDLAALTGGTLHDVCELANIKLYLKEIASAVLSEMDTEEATPQSPESPALPSGSAEGVCVASARSAAERASAYLKATRFAQQACASDRKACVRALAASAEAFATLDSADRALRSSCSSGLQRSPERSERTLPAPTKDELGAPTVPVRR